MTEPQMALSGTDQPGIEAERPRGRRVAAPAEEIARIGGRLAEVEGTLRRCAGDLGRLEGRAGKQARLLASLRQGREGQLDETERLARRLDALGQEIQAQRQAVAGLGTRLEGPITLVGELAGRPAAGTGGERAIWWPDLPVGPERTAALRLLRAWVDEVLRGHHPGLVTDRLQGCGLAMRRCSTS